MTTDDSKRPCFVLAIPLFLGRKSKKSEQNQVKHLFFRDNFFGYENQKINYKKIRYMLLLLLPLLQGYFRVVISQPVKKPI